MSELTVGVVGAGWMATDYHLPAFTSHPRTRVVAFAERDGDRRATVEMTDDLNFEPETLTVSVGDTVDWPNVGSVAHSVTAYEEQLPDGAAYFASGGFDSESAARSAYPSEGSVGADESYSHTFETAGEFPYFCIPHESSMVGTIIVESA